jgi:hypothetical protein
MKIRLAMASALVTLFIAVQAGATPRQGSRELRIGQHYMPPSAITDGFIHLEPEHGEGISALGLGGGLGYFVTSNFEIGGSVSLVSVDLNIGSNVLGPGLNPFLRVFGSQGRVGYFAEADVELLHLSNDDSSVTVWSVGGDVGLEAFVTDDWAIRIAPTYRHLIVKPGEGASGASGESGDRLGITWGLAAYF